MGRPASLPSIPDMPPLGAWADEALCADSPLDFTADNPTPDQLDQLEAVCWRCPARQECADYAATTPVWGMWGADWHEGRAARPQPRRDAA